MSVLPLPYHLALLDHLRTHETELWEWFSTEQTRQRTDDALRLELLKSTYRLPEAEHGRLYELAREAATRIEVDAPLTIYQAVDHGVLNAGVSRFANEAHLVLCGPLQDKLNDDELMTLFGHELSHLKLWSGWDGAFLIAEELIAALADEDSGNDTYIATERLFRLYAEVFCDRGALLAAGGDCLTVIAVLIRLETSLDTLRPESFLEQVDEILADQNSGTAGVTHPEAYIRAKAIHLWAEHQQDAEGDPEAAAEVDRQITKILEGPASLTSLDLIGRKRIETLTTRLINTLLQPQWMRTELNLNHARLFFPEYQFDAAEIVKSSDLGDDLDNSIRDYLCYVMLDFATTDRSLEQIPLAHVLETAKTLKLEKRLGPLVQKELRIRKRQYAELIAQSGQMVEQASQKDTEL